MNKNLNYKKWAFNKKRLHLKRKRYKKKIFVPRVIVDTNIWYALADDEELFNKVKSELYPIYNNLWELSNTGRIHSNPEKVMNTIRKVMLCSKRMIIDEPLKHLINKSNKGYKPYITRHTQDMLNFTQKIANGYFIDENQKENFQKHIKETKEGLDEVKSNFNNTALECKERIKNYEKHRRKETWFLIVHFIDFMARQATEGKFNLKKLPLKDYELLILVMDKYFKKLETGETIWQRNDLYDLFNLAYVRRGDKYWTNEKKWIDIIKEVGCEHYLYKI